MVCETPSSQEMAAMISLTRGGGMLVRLATAGAICVSIVGLSLAAEGWSAIKRPTHVDAQGLGPALEVLAKQHGFQVLYRTEIVGGLRTQSVDGQLTTDEALHQLLIGSGLTYRYLDDEAVTIVPLAAGAPAGTAAPLPSGAERAKGDDSTNSDQKAKGSFWDRFRLAQVDQGQISTPSTVEKQDEQVSKKKPLLLEEVVVTGSRIPTAAGAGAKDVKVYKREQIDQSGQTTVSDFLNTLPEVSVLIPDYGRTGNGGTTVQLHGLPIGTTLVL